MLPVQDSRWDSQKSRHLVLEEKKEKQSNFKFQQQFVVMIIIECREQLALTSAGRRGMRWTCTCSAAAEAAQRLEPEGWRGPASLDLEETRGGGDKDTGTVQKREEEEEMREKNTRNLQRNPKAADRLTDWLTCCYLQFVSISISTVKPARRQWACTRTHTQHKGYSLTVSGWAQVSLVQITSSTGVINTGHKLFYEEATGLWGLKILLVCWHLIIFYFHHYRDKCLTNQTMRLCGFFFKILLIQLTCTYDENYRPHLFSMGNLALCVYTPTHTHT